jgi:hypothetical protein
VEETFLSSVGPVVVVNAQILHNKSSKKNISEIFYEKVAEGRIAH